jgi:hypothetical protein
MKRRCALLVLTAAIVSPPAHSQAAPSITPAPSAGDISVTLSTAPAATSDTVALYSVAPADKGKCIASGAAVKLADNSSNLVLGGATTRLELDTALASDYYLCAKITSHTTGAVTPTAEVAVGAGCNTPGTYTDCTFYYMLIGGIEQSDLSAQSSVTEGFYDLFIRRPVDSTWGSIWFRSRYLGTPSSSSTQNVVAAATNPTGTLTASNLPQSVTAVDYTLGLQFDHWRNESKSISYSPIVGFGATTPLSATTTVSGLVVPAYGTSECNQLHLRFSNAYGYSPALPAAGPDPTTPTTMDCVVQPNPASTTAAGTKITDIAFSNQDRTSFLLKWGVGMRLIDRYRLTGASTCADTAGCSRLMADFTIGQDQAITGGYWRHLVVKADAIIPVVQTGAYFFAASANRIESSTTFSPLILTPITVTANSGSSTCTTSSTTICVPSPSVFVLPYKQQNRDYYRIGIGIDVQKIFTKLFGSSSNK